MKEIRFLRRYRNTKGNTERKSGTLMVITCECERKHTHAYTHALSRTWEYGRPCSSTVLCLSLYRHDNQTTQLHNFESGKIRFINLQLFVLKNWKTTINLFIFSGTQQYSII